MRVITGTARGRKLVTVEGTEVVRPTTDGVKEAIFSAIQFRSEEQCSTCSQEAGSLE